MASSPGSYSSSCCGPGLNLLVGCKPFFGKALGCGWLAWLSGGFWLCGGWLWLALLSGGFWLCGGRLWVAWLSGGFWLCGGWLWVAWLSGGSWLCRGWLWLAWLSGGFWLSGGWLWLAWLSGGLCFGRGWFFSWFFGAVSSTSVSGTVWWPGEGRSLGVSEENGGWEPVWEECQDVPRDGASCRQTIKSVFSSLWPYKAGRTREIAPGGCLARCPWPSFYPRAGYNGSQLNGKAFVNASNTIESILSKAPRRPASGPKAFSFLHLPPWLKKSRSTAKLGPRLGPKHWTG